MGISRMEGLVRVGGKCGYSQDGGASEGCVGIARMEGLVRVGGKCRYSQDGGASEGWREVWA